MRSTLLVTIFIFISLISFAQKGKIEGKVIDSKTGQPLAGVSVVNKTTKQGSATNVEGRYTINIEGVKTVSLLFTYNGVTQQIDEIEIKDGVVTTQDVSLTQREKTEESVVVRTPSTARRESAASLITFQKNTSVVASVISAEAIKRSPDKNTGEVLKRVPGTSVQDGKYLVVRGLADRYNQAMLNGILLSSTEPDRKTFSFDIFPSSIIDNIIINKTFIPELPGEWAGGIVQVNTKDVPAKNFLAVQVGTGFNTATVGKDFYSYMGSNTDFLGYDNGARSLPSVVPRRAVFTDLLPSQKTALVSSFSNNWTASTKNNDLSQLNSALQISGGFVKPLGEKSKVAAVFALNYNRTNKRLEFENRIFGIQNNIASLSFDYSNNKYSQDILAGALANLSFQLGKDNKISFKNILNVNTTNYATIRTGKDFETNSTVGDNIRATELAFKANTFYNSQVSGDHNINPIKAKLHWYGSFNILDQYVPDQRRLQYNQDDPTNPASPYSLLISASNSSQRTGSRYFGNLNDYIYTAGGDLAKTFNVQGAAQTIKGGYFFQVKDRLFDSRPFAIYLPADNPTLRHLDPSVIFDPANFGNGNDNKFAFNEISGNRFRYVANSIMNAGFLQFDNQLLKKVRIVWGLRVEDFDQLIGSYKKSDERFVNTKKTDYLPGANITYKINNKTNLRFSGSQTVVRPEFRELSTFSFFDFDLGATVTGNPKLERTKITNADMRYELYPRAGELLTVGVFYKKFIKPIELFANTTGAGSSNTFNYVNADDATSYGAEFEFRKKLEAITALKNFTLQGNFSYIYNRIPTLKRPMQGQSPYLINLALQYDIEKAGINTTLLFNQIGRRIYYVGSTTLNGGSVADDTPPVYEAPRPLLDFQISKKIIARKGEIKLNVSDIFNRPANFYHDLNDNKKYDKATDALALRRVYGSNISINFSYNIK